MFPPPPEPTKTPKPTATPDPSVAPTPTATPNPDVCPNIDGIQTSLPSDYHFDNDGINCLKFELGGAPTPPAIGGANISPQVLGASTMAATGVAVDNIMHTVFGIGSFLTSLGIISSGKKKQ